jgi:hypothetical protein
MGHGKFTKAYLPATGDVIVTGPFDPDDEKVNLAKIIFLVVQVQDRDTVVVRGEGVWKRDPGGGETEWFGTVPRHGDLDLGPSNKELREEGGRMTRGIALSVVVQPSRVLQSGFDPPSIEALTWCADLQIVGGEPPSPASST